MRAPFENRFSGLRDLLPLTRCWVPVRACRALSLSALAALLLLSTAGSALADTQHPSERESAALEDQVLGVQSTQAEASALAASPPEALMLAPMETQLLELLNRTRSERGLPPVEVDPRLERLARLRSDDLATRGYFSHVTPEGSMVFDLMNQQGIPYRLAAENLGRTNSPQGESAQLIHKAFLASPQHAENDLDPSFNRVGIGVAVSPAGMTYYTEVFAILN